VAIDAVRREAILTVIGRAWEAVGCEVLRVERPNGSTLMTGRRGERVIYRIVGADGRSSSIREMNQDKPF
jgi:hypothetical protein